MDKGQIVEMGPHDALVQKPNGLYAHLWRMQDGGQPT
jgi:subfamily B ATP-binding cassette protein HlyB/CyaB